MRPVLAGHQAHLDTGPLSDKHLVTVTRHDGTVKRLTDLDADISAGGNTYIGGFVNVGAMTWEIGQNPFTIDADFVVSAASPINEGEVIAGHYQGATVEIALVNFDDPTQSTPLATGFVGDVSHDDAGNFTFDIVGLWSVASLLRMRTITTGCQTWLGHPTWCKVNVAGEFTHTVAVASVIDSGAITISGDFDPRAAADDTWYTHGAGKWLTGANAGWSFAIRKWTASGAIVEFWGPMRGAVQIGDTLDVHVGCDKTYKMNHERFNNLSHFQGFPHAGPRPQGRR